MPLKLKPINIEVFDAEKVKKRKVNRVRREAADEVASSVSPESSKLPRIHTMSKSEKLAKELQRQREREEQQERERKLSESVVHLVAAKQSEKAGQGEIEDTPVSFSQVIQVGDDERAFRAVEAEMAREVERLTSMLDDRSVWSGFEMDPSLIAHRKVAALKALASLRKERREHRLALLEDAVRVVLEAFRTAAKTLTTPDQYNLIIEAMRKELETRMSDLMES